MSSSKKVTVGYKYYLGMHMVACSGPVDKVVTIRVDNKVAWQGVSTGGQISISAEGLFGGEDGNNREGGVSGLVDFLPGGPSQGQNDYLLSKLGSLLPSFRGVASFVLRQCYVGMNPYLKRWSFKIQRIHTRQNGLTQWYDEKAEISSDAENVPYNDYWYYQTVSTTTPPSDPYSFPVPSSGWSGPAQAPFGHIATGYTPPYPVVTAWAPQTALWLKRTVSLETRPTYLKIEGRCENAAFVFFDGVYIGSNNPTNADTTNWQAFSHDVPSGLLTAGDHTVALYCMDEATTNSNDNTYVHVVVTGGVQSDMNPAHIIRECLTDPDWGMGYNEEDIDDDTFMTAADKLYDEGMGISLLWNSQIIIEEFIKEIVKHIEASLFVDRTSGKFVLKLIRDDYDPDDLIELGEDEIDKIEDFKRPQFGELTTSVTVKYWASISNTEGSITLQDIALEQMQQAAINTTIQYPGFSNAVIASRCAQRDLKTLSSQLFSCTVYTDRTAKDLQIGSVFKLTWPDYELSQAIVRVTGIAYGDGKNNRIRLSCAEDVFSLPDTAYITPSDPAWVDPNGPPTAATSRLAFEVPYLELVQKEGQTAIDDLLADTPEAGRVGIAAGRPGSAINARMQTDAGSGYTEAGLADFCPTATLSGDLDRISTVFPITDAVDITQVVLGSWCQCGTEIMAVVALSSSSMEVERGCLDTVPTTHSDGATIFFWDNDSGQDSTQYLDGESINIKLQPLTGSGELTLADAPVDVVTLDSRAIRPYPPGNLKIQAEYFPALAEGDLVLTWAHRNRLTQTGDSLVGFPEASITPEAGTTYTLRFYNESNTLVRTVTGITGTTYTYSSETSDGGPFNPIRFTLHSVRDSLESYYHYDVTIERPVPVESLGVFIPEPTAPRPMTILVNNDKYIVSIVGTTGEATVVGIYSIPLDLSADPTFLGTTYDGRDGDDGQYIPDTYFHTLPRGTSQGYMPLTAGGVDSKFSLHWRRQNGGVPAPDGRWLLNVDDSVPTISISDTGSVLAADPFVMIKVADGTLYALTAGSPPKAWRSTNDGTTWSNLGNTTGLPNFDYLSTFKSFELGDGSVAIATGFGIYKSTDMLAWANYLISAHPSDLAFYASYSLKDVEYSGTSMIAVCEYVESNQYTAEVLSDSPVSWQRCGDQNYNTLLDTITGNLSRFSPPAGGISGAGISQVDGLIGGANADLIASAAMKCTVATYLEPRTAGNGPVNFISGTTDFSIEMWIALNPDSVPDNSWTITLFTQIKLYGAGFWYQQIYLGYNVGTQDINLVIKGYESNPSLPGSIECNISGTSAADLFDGDPHHIVVTRGAGGRADIYVDGVNTATRASGTVSDLSYSTLQAGTIFGNTFGANAVHYYSIIDECAIYLTELSSARVSAHYDAGIAAGVVRNMIHKSADEGETWTIVRDIEKEADIAPSFAFNLQWNQAVKFGTGFAVYGFSPFGGAFPYVLLSDDDGDTWTTHKVETDDGTDNAVILNAISDGTRVLATIGSGLVYPQFNSSTDAINFTAIGLTFNPGAAGVTLRIAETGEARVTEIGDIRVTE